MTLESGVDPGSKIMDFNAALVAARPGRPKQHLISAAARFGDPRGKDSAEADITDILLAQRKERKRRGIGTATARTADRVRGEGGCGCTYSFAVSGVESDFYATAFQHAIDTNDCDRFDALCFLAGGKPEIIEDFSTASFFDSDTVEKAAIDDTTSTYSTASPLTPTLESAGMYYPVDLMQPCEPTTSFMEKVAAMGGFTRSALDPDPSLAWLVVYGCTLGSVLVDSATECICLPSVPEMLTE
ncbi:hypothetical protein CYMTET_22685 [Cymbomonas tetramitiformis]|uniref:Uncharacterized protein n=1 Tax=Cymbomonas tetramitiformis TaxID=36881 RepID=A0AAE0G092_9CHLO|nr:hypothetical protein CYMTET_22685 [Cymbomonas tetramitiformis]